MGKLDARLEVRVDKQTYQRLERRAAVERSSVGEIVRKAIARELSDEDDVSWRLEVLERAFRLNVPVPDDPDELARELAKAYEWSPDEKDG